MREVIDRLARLPEEERLKILRRDLGEAGIRALCHHWEAWAHHGQLPPPGDWRVWLVRAGRGFGKTRAGAEWISAVARDRPNGRIALVGANWRDVQRVMVEGESGLIATARAGERFTWRREAGVFTFASGAQAFCYSAAAPESLRGPEHISPGATSWPNGMARRRGTTCCWG